MGKLSGIREQVMGDNPWVNKRCQVAKATEQLDPEDVAELFAMLYDERLTATSLSTHLVDAGLHLTAGIIRHHRGRQCVWCRANGLYPEVA